MAKTAKQKRADVRYAQFLKILKWILILFFVYIVLNVAFKTAWNTFHWDGSLPVTNGEVKKEDTWLIQNERTVANPKYFLYATVETPDGWTLQNETLLADPNETDFLFLPEQERGFVQAYITVTEEPLKEAASSGYERLKLYYTDGKFSAIEETKRLNRNSIEFSYAYSGTEGMIYARCVYIESGKASVMVSLTGTDADLMQDEMDNLIKKITLKR